MLVNIVHGSKGEHRKLFLAGIAMMTAMLLLVALSIAIYQKAFTPTTMVTIKADRAGLQLAQFGDVRIHGVLVGQVRGIKQDGKQASIKVGLNPDSARNIPQNVSVEILPTTLFGQKYVALVDPDRPSDRSLSDGDVIPSSRVKTNVELSTILANLFPLLRSIRPADLNATLTAIAGALRGRGEKLGQTLEKMDTYLTGIRPHLPTLRRDLVLLARVARTYAIAAPDLIRILRNATVTAQTVTDDEDQIRLLLGDVTTLAMTGRRVLSRNEAAIIKEGRLARPLLRLLDTYSPQSPCLLKGSARYEKRLIGIFDTNRVRQGLRLNAPQKKSYTAKDKPIYGEVGHGPWCLGLPSPPQPVPPISLRNGTYKDGGE